MADEKILSYNDVVLRKSDLSILSGPYFLNDRIIEFYFSYLTSFYPSQDILIVPPGISFWITNCPDVESLKEVVEPLKLPEKKVVIFAVNNNTDVTRAEGGTHWTLLAYERNTNVFVHHDSIAGANLREAKRLYNAVKRFMDVSAGSSSAKFLFRDVSTPQQKNGYDCGLFVTAIARFICEWHSNGGGSKHNKDSTEKEEELWLNVLNEKEVQSTVSKMRNDILKLIQDMIPRSEVYKDLGWGD